MPFKTKEQKSEYDRKRYQQKNDPSKKENNKQYQQTFRDKKKMEQQQEHLGGTSHQRGHFPRRFPSQPSSRHSSTQDKSDKLVSDSSVSIGGN